ncbi:MAG: hypothetical protein AAF514_09155 [Verrucomicrobiota bacterium]
MKRRNDAWTRKDLAPNRNLILLDFGQRVGHSPTPVNGSTRFRNIEVR